ncbi:hypothetical protein Tsubulata_045076 [Turnera subulata]|uniref:Uncharacterized protein n=1 Tax=Turnera subulata TaxID=218843 RepID=A0A9Q0J835_9ROSI|nr:hypothetical protein Tsubulata_045076 [Turnera subulata]
MNKLLEFGRKAMFYVRVLSGYEERRIRNYRLMLEKKLQKVSSISIDVSLSFSFCAFQAQAEKEAMKLIPEKLILTEVRRMVEDMQKLNKTLEQTEKAIEEYFSPLDKQAEAIMKMQLESQSKSMTEMAKAMQAEVLREHSRHLKNENLEDTDSNQRDQESGSSSKQQAQTG